MTEAEPGRGAYAYRRLLLVLTGSDADAVRVDAALALAAEHGARLDAAYVHHQPGGSDPPTLFLPQAVLGVYARRDRDAAEAVGERFLRRLDAAGVYGGFRYRAGHAGREIERLARGADLVVGGQSGNGGNAPPAPGADVGRYAVLQLGRPLLLVPYVGAARRFGRRVLVAWDGAREAARAVADALPLLRRAGHVTVLSVDPQEKRSGDELCARLARHGVSARADVEAAAGLGVADVLLSYAVDRRCDLIVAGAGHRSPAVEALVSSVVDRLLRQSGVPLLLSC